MKSYSWPSNRQGQRALLEASDNLPILAKRDVVVPNTIKPDTLAVLPSFILTLWNAMHQLGLHESFV